MRPIISLAAGLLWSSAALAADTPLSMAELDRLRGGFVLPDGTDLAFSATMRSAVDGQTVLATTVDWTNQGAVVTSTGGLSRVITGADGTATTVAQTVTAQGLTGLVLNNRNGAQVSQSTVINLTLANYQAMLAQHTAGMWGITLGQGRTAAPP